MSHNHKKSEMIEQGCRRSGSEMLDIHTWSSGWLNDDLVIVVVKVQNLSCLMVDLSLMVMVNHIRPI
jgi:hypothetical protein